MSGARLGPRQLRLLAQLGNPAVVLLAPIDRRATSLERRGLIRFRDSGAAQITPHGLRVLADKLMKGDLEEPLGLGGTREDKAIKAAEACRHVRTTIRVPAGSS